MNNLEQARFLFDESLYLDAIPLLLEAAEENDCASEAVGKLIFSYSATGRNDLATEVFHRFGVDTPYTNGMLLEVAAAQGDEELAMRCLSKAEAEPGYEPYLASSLGLLYLNCRKFETALLHLWKAEAAFPGDAVIIGRIAVALFELGRVVEARELLVDHLQRQPRNTSLLRALLRIQVAEGEDDEASRTEAQILELSPTDPAGYVAVGRGRLVRKDYRAALDAFESALDLWPNFNEALMGRAIARGKLGDADGAVADLRTLIANSPNNAEAVKELMRYLFRRGRFREGFRVAKRFTSRREGGSS
jgi:Flp pilus assembly protein TadD